MVSSYEQQNRRKKEQIKDVPRKCQKTSLPKNKTGRSQRHKEKTETIAKKPEISQRLISNYCFRDLINHSV